MLHPAPILPKILRGRGMGSPCFESGEAHSVATRSWSTGPGRSGNTCGLDAKLCGRHALEASATNRPASFKSRLQCGGVIDTFPDSSVGKCTVTQRETRLRSLHCIPQQQNRITIHRAGIFASHFLAYCIGVRGC